MKNKALYEAIENYKPISAWNKGLKVFALEIVESAEKYITMDNIKEVILNGADNYRNASYGGAWLIYDSDIAERFCSPSELKRTKNGEKEPNARESWLDLQARAAFQVELLIKKAILKGSTIKSWK